MSDDDNIRKFFKGGELKMSMTVIGYDVAELEALAERNPEAAAVLIASCVDVNIVDPKKFSASFPRVAKLLAMKAEAKAKATKS